MAEDKQQWSNIAAYLSGQLADAEKTSFEAWVSSTAENKTAFEEAKKIWASASVKLQYPEVDAAQLLADIKSEIESNRPKGKVISLLHQPVWKVAIAASISLIAISYFIFQFSSQDNVFISSENEVLTFYLPDSSKVWLNTDSKITYLKKFDKRNVELSGEAFLMVRKDSSRPFTIAAGNSLTKVVGTAFNLREQGDSTVTLTVAEGVVDFSNANSKSEEHVFVEAQEKAVLTNASKLTKAKNNDPSFATWRERNNPAFGNEKKDPVKFLLNNYTWRKNAINQSVIEGTLINRADLAAYTEIILNVTYAKADGTLTDVDITINDIVYPGKKIEYKKRLLDIFSDTKSIVVKVKSATAVTHN